MDILTGVTTAIALAKQLLEFGSVAKDAQAKMVLADLQIQLAEVKVKLADLMNENTELKDKLKKALDTVPEVEIRDGLYYKKDGGDGPFCTSCYDSGKKLIRVIEADRNIQRLMGNRWRCNVCKAHFN